MDKKEELLKTAEEGKLVQGIIFEDDPNANLIKGIVFEDDEPERKDDDIEYLVFFKYSDDDGNEIKDWKEIKGRTELYEFLKQNVESMILEESYILSDSVLLEAKLTVYDFFKEIVEKYNLFPNDDFRIDDYR